jgi:MHS family alpha-ketoglutarate permease-like MFS transporter
MKAILGGSAGNLVEWYDWFAYASFSIYFADVFFPETDPTVRYMKTAGVFALGFIARPVGAWLMGLYADRAGRRAALSLAVAMMSLGSLAVALTPGYATIGAAAPAVLLAARLLQGLSVGGEYGASATYMSEVAGKKRRGFWSSFQYVTLILGQLVAAAVLVVIQQTLTRDQIGAWGWRIPFVIGAALAVVVLWIRLGLEESESFTKAKASGERARSMLLFTHYPRQTAIILGLTAGGSLGYYTYTTYMLKFLTNTAGFSKEQAGAINFATLIGFMLAQPVIGWLSDKVGRKTMLALAFGGGAAIAWPVFTTLSHTQSTAVAGALIFGSLVVLTGYTAVSAVVKAELFPAHCRAMGVALPYAVANAAFGGTAEYVALWFKHRGMESGFYIYVAIVMAAACLIALTMRETSKHSLIQED